MPNTGFYKDLPPLFCLTGIDGCGKSTHLKRLALRLQQEKNLKASFLSVWDISRNQRYQSHAFIADKAAIYRYLATLHGGARMLFIAHALMESLELVTEEKPDLILADGYWYKYLFSESLHGLPVDWLLPTVASFPVPRFTMFLDLPPERSWARKPALTPYECGMKEPGEQTFLAFQTRLRAELGKFVQKQGWPLVDVDRPEDVVAAEIWEMMKKEV